MRSDDATEPRNPTDPEIRQLARFLDRVLPAGGLGTRGRLAGARTSSAELLAVRLSVPHRYLGYLMSFSDSMYAASHNKFRRRPRPPSGVPNPFSAARP